MAGTFHERIAQLGESVGSGRLVGRITVDQLYAHYQ
jgi:hypothetical protein